MREFDAITRAEAPAEKALQRLRKNIGGYFGETIDITAVIADCIEAARAHGWTIEEVPVAGKPPLLAFSKDLDGCASLLKPGTSAPAIAPLVYLSSGIHGDEPAGPLAMRQLLRDNAWPAGIRLRLFPCLNVAGFVLNRRENPEGCDLNRDYLNPSAPETRAHSEWLLRQPPFNVCLCLHEDWESEGFYVYELNPDHQHSLAEAIIAAVSRVCPIDTSELIEGRPAQGGIIRPSIDPRSRPQWPEAFYLLTHKTRLSYTLEAPSDYPLQCRADALATGAQAALQEFIRSQQYMGGGPDHF